MIVFLDETGNIITSDTAEPIGRNSADVSRIYIVTKMSAASVFYLSFRLPNGTNIFGGFAEESESAAALIRENVEGFNVFLYKVGDNVTKYAGEVTFTVYGVTPTMRTSATSSFVVNNAVRVDIGDTPNQDAWNAILEEISRINEKMLDIDADLAKKLEKAGEGAYKRAYTVNADGEQSLTPLKEYPDANSLPVYKSGGTIAVNLGAGGDAVPRSFVEESTERLGARISNLEQAAEGTLLTFVEEKGVGDNIPVPFKALKYASLRYLGAHTSLSPFTYAEGVNAWSVSGNEGYVTYTDGVLTMNSGALGIFDVGALDVTITNGDGYNNPVSAGLYKMTNASVNLSFAVKVTKGGAVIYEKTISASASEAFTFVVPQDLNAYNDKLEITITNPESFFVTASLPIAQNLSLSNSFDYKNPQGITIRGKNLLPSTVYNISKWETLSNGYRVFYFTFLEEGTYTVSARTKDGTPFGSTLNLRRSLDGGATWSAIGICADGSDGYLLTSTIGKNKKTFNVTSETTFRLIFTGENSAFERVGTIQIEYGESETDYAPFFEITKELPEAVKLRFATAYGIDADHADRIDLDTKEYITAVGVRAYQQGDEDNPAFLTNGLQTLYPLAEEVRESFANEMTNEAELTSDILEVEAKGVIELSQAGIAYDATFQDKI